MEKNQTLNIRIELEKDTKIKLSKDKTPPLRKELKNLISRTEEINNFEGMLLE